MDLAVFPERLIANRFKLQAVAGSGGMGTVYRAQDLESGQPVALKLLHAEAVGGAELERFGREAKLLSELQHGGIVSYVAHGQAESGQPFLAMEWLEGEDLAQRLRRGILSLVDSLTLLRGVAAALALAHRRGIIHRELWI
jgi:serine/threonine protein kinase